ncbi:MAG: hypothetical protein CM1200mP33_1480 [Chloroflexota bacterium]|nr:MAG: hypothetical protein CM1200mP33_1480 [Chloroflexota bacterium]
MLQYLCNQVVSAICINALASLNIPARIPIPMFINLRGKIWGEFNIAQVTMGRSTKPILDLLNIPHITLDSEIDLKKKCFREY